ncbi:MAG: hypothetical protein ACOYJK_10960 [Prevotella sp.]|jgi:hypothetical protein
MGRWRTGVLAFLLMMGITACEVDDYDSGDNRYSYMRADFGMLHTTTDTKADYVLTDDGDSIFFSKSSPVKWATTADTLYRALVYYDVASKQFFSAKPVGVVTPVLKPQTGTISTDPLTIESLWVSGGFLNIGFAVKTGQTDSVDVQQQIGLMLEGVAIDVRGKNVFTLRVMHAQNNIPEYYTVRAYMSMPLTDDMQGAAIRLRVNTYEGEKIFLML